MPTKDRIEKVKRVLSLRQPDLRIVLEEVENTHNASAVLRTCDAAGVLNVDIISLKDEPFPIHEAITTGAERWLKFHYYHSTSECLNSLKQKGLKIASTSLRDDALPYTALDYTQPIAIAFGNEAEGISSDALTLSDYVIKIPMLGMTQSLNLSVAVGIILFEALRQRKERGLFIKKRLPSSEFKSLMKKWLRL